jgi:putative flippase GtrA
MPPDGSRATTRMRERNHRRATDRSHREWVRFGEFFLISITGFAIDTAVLNAMVLGAGFGSALESVGAKAFSASAAGLINFLMHRHWTFRDRPGSFWRELGRYAIVRVSAIALSLFLFGWFRYGFARLLSPHLDPHLTIAWSANLAQIASSMLVLLFSYGLHWRFTFAEPGATGRRRWRRRPSETAGPKP